MIGPSTQPFSAETHLVPSRLGDDVREYCQAVLRYLRWPAAGGEQSEGDAAAPAVRTLGVTSCSRQEGVSTVASRLAMTAAEMHEGAVLLVDANLVCPMLHDMFDIDLSPGLSESLLNPGALPTCVQPSGYDNLEVLAAGEPNGSLPKAFDTDGIQKVIAAIEREYALIVFDMPPAGQQSAALRLAGLLDAVIIVVEAERTRFEVARRARQLLERAGASVRGAVLNKRRYYVPKWLYRKL